MYKIKIAKWLYLCKFQYPGTYVYFSKYIAPNNGKNADQCSKISMTDAELAVMRAGYPKNHIGPYSEFNSLVYTFSDALLDHNSFCFHGAAFMWKGIAILLTAPSGVGKTTHYKNWKTLYENEIQIINGDKPIIEYRNDDTFWVYSSPWNGKEGYGSETNAQLGAIIYLEQGNENMIARMTEKEAVIPIFGQFLTLLPTETSCHKLAWLEENMLRNIPIYKLVNTGNLDSAKLTHDLLLQEL